MKLPKFEVEQWMTDHEGDAVFNLTDTCVSPFSLDELLAMDQDHLFSGLTLDYGAITGDIRLRRELLKLYKSGSEDSITTAQGCLQGAELVMETLLNAGDRVIAYVPGYQAFTAYPRSLGCTVTALELYEEDGWQPRLDELEQAMEQPVKLVIVNNPANPTGVIFRKEYRDRLIELCKAQGTWILSDEIYRDPRCPSLSDLYDQAVSVSSLSKMYSLAGLRLGWIKGPEDLIHTINERRDYSIISTGPLVDTLGLVAMKKREAILARSRSIIEADQRAVREFLRENPEFSVVLPEYGTVCFLRYEGDIPSRQLADHALKNFGVFFVPGCCFDCENHLRLGLTCSPETMAKGLRLLAEARRDLCGR